MRVWEPVHAGARLLAVPVPSPLPTLLSRSLLVLRGRIGGRHLAEYPTCDGHPRHPWTAPRPPRHGRCALSLCALWRARPRLHVPGHIHGRRGVERMLQDPEKKVPEGIVTGRAGWVALLRLLWYKTARWVKGTPSKF